MIDVGTDQDETFFRWQIEGLRIGSCHYDFWVSSRTRWVYDVAVFGRYVVTRLERRLLLVEGSHL